MHFTENERLRNSNPTKRRVNSDALEESVPDLGVNE
jgi:hypothetical protein